jgi:hypothetical protein
MGKKACKLLSYICSVLSCLYILVFIFKVSFRLQTEFSGMIFSKRVTCPHFICIDENCDLFVYGVSFDIL